jgi:hypothetical protein
MIEPSTTIAAGRDAWQRLRDHDRARWTDWLDVARALAVGRTESLKAAGTNRPVGSRYNGAMGAWLRSADLDGINNQERYRALLILENLPAIERWRAGLDDAQRRRLNHPNAIWAHWRRSTRAETAAPTRQCVRGAKPHRTGKPIFWPQDTLRRAAEALRGCPSNDIFTMARVVLESAIRSEGDLFELLQPDHLRGKANDVAMSASKACTAKPRSSLQELVS